MNKKITLLIAGLIYIVSMFVSTPTVSAQTLSTICNNSTTTTTISGRIVMNGSNSASVWFEWGSTQSLGSSTTRQTFYSDSNFSQQIHGLIENTTYHYRAMGADDEGVITGNIESFSTNCSNQAPTVNISANPSNVTYNGSSIITWNSNNTTSCTGNGGSNGWSGNKSLSGNFSTGTLTNTTTYNITCVNVSGTQTNTSTTVNVGNQIPQTCNDQSAINYGGNLPCRYNQSQPSVSLNADNTNIDMNDSTTLRWTSTNATLCYGNGGTNGWAGNKNRGSSFNTGRLTGDTTFRITCENENGNEKSDSVTVRIKNQTQLCQDVNALNYGGSVPCKYNTVVNNPQPSIVLSADNTSVTFNSATTIRWYTTNSNSCTATGGSVGWAGPKNVGSGSFFTGSLNTSRTYTITCVNNYGSKVDSATVNVHPLTSNTQRVAPTSLVLITSTVDKTQPIIPNIDNSRPEPGDEINYTVAYQSISTGAITKLRLQLVIPYEVDYMFSSPNNPSILGNTLIFNFGTLKANGEGKVSVRVRVRENISSGTQLNFPAMLSYIDTSGSPQSVNANVSAEVFKATTIATPTDSDTNTKIQLEGNVFSAGFLPSNIFGWLLLIILILILILSARYAFVPPTREVNNTPPPPLH